MEGGRMENHAAAFHVAAW